MDGALAALREIFEPPAFFEMLGVRYTGPFDGHDIPGLERALRNASEFDGPIVVHVVTRKGRGYAPAENDQADHMHGIGKIDPETGKAPASSGTSWTKIFADELCAVGEDHDEVVAITAAMPGPTGLSAFAERFPDRMYDVGIAEQHASPRRPAWPWAACGLWSPSTRPS